MADGPKTSKLRGSNELMINELVLLLFPEGKEPRSIDEWNLRLWLVPGILHKYGLAPES